MPPVMADMFNAYEHNAHNVTLLMLSALRGGYVPEWSNIYGAITTFVNEMYLERNTLYLPFILVGSESVPL